MVRKHDRNSTVVMQKAWLTDVNNDYLVKHVVKLGSEEYHQVATCQGLALQLCSDQTSALCSNASNVANVVKQTEHDAESCEIVAEWFAEDFSAFGYNSSACPPFRTRDSFVVFGGRAGGGGCCGDCRGGKWRRLRGQSWWCWRWSCWYVGVAVGVGVVVGHGAGISQAKMFTGPHTEGPHAWGAPGTL